MLVPIVAVTSLLVGALLSLGARQIGVLDAVLGKTISEKDATALADKKFTEGETFGRQKGFAAGDEAGYLRGFEEGKTSGGSDGYSNGYNVGFTDGSKAGFTDGEEVGYEKGLAAGTKNGYDQGFTDGCEKVFELANYAGAVIAYSPSNGRIGSRYVERYSVC